MKSYNDRGICYDEKRLPCDCLGRPTHTAITCIDGHWYAFGGAIVALSTDNATGRPTPAVRVVSLGRDGLWRGAHWFAECTPEGVRFVASASPTKSAAISKARRHGQYVGVLCFTQPQEGGDEQ